jgi:DNA-binding NarL/FixJ family response regulator
VYVSVRIRRAALEQVLRASIELDVSLIGHEFQIKGPRGPATTLTAREADILQLVSEGLRNGEIAGRVGLSENTIEFHVGRVLDKLGARNRVQATATAIRFGVI